MTRISPQRTLLAAAALGTLAATSACSAAEDTDAGSTGTADRSGADTGYVAGDYSAEGSYTTPGGEEKIGVDVTLAADGTIEALTVTPMGVNPNSKQFQAKFVSGIEDVAVGQDISTLSVDKVAGSSLSSGGFNAALDAIAESATA